MKDENRATGHAKHVKSVKFDREVQDRIGEQLRAMYDHVTREPVPDRFLRLLDELERQDRPKAK